MAIDVHWLEQSQTDLPDARDWLSESELQHLRSLRFVKRRDDWLLGRWTAKLAVATYLQLFAESLAELEIKAAPSGAPEAFFRGAPADSSISLSHAAGVSLCAVAPLGGCIGCDLEIVEPRSDAFIGDYFTPREQALVDRATPRDRDALVTLLWSAKESALKALQEGLRLDTRCVEVDPGDFCSVMSSHSYHAEWRPLQVRYSRTRLFYGWWRFEAPMVRTVVSTSPLAYPHSLSPCETAPICN